MLILVEGQDGVGKSSFIQRVIEHDRYRDPAAHWRVLTAGRPRGSNLLTEYLEPLLSYSLRRQDTVICDRWFLGELVYPALTGRATLAEPLQLHYLVQWLRAQGALLVHLTAPEDVVLERLVRRDPTDPDADAGQVARQAKLFATAVAEVRDRGLATLTLDTSADDTYRQQLVLRQQAARLTFDAADVRVRPTQRTEPPAYIGPLSPRLLLVGDEQGPAYPSLEVPFVPLLRGCGAYLWQALAHTEPARLRPESGRYSALEGWRRPPALSDLGAVNGNDSRLERPAHLRGLWHQLGQPPVVALGSNAWRAVRAARLPANYTAVAPHPQWVRRFHHRHLDTYGAALWATADDLQGRDLRQTWQTCTR